MDVEEKKFDKPWHLVGGSQVPEDEPELGQGAVKDVVVVKDDLVVEVFKTFRFVTHAAP